MVSVVLDTNSVIAYLKGDRDVAKRIELTPELLLPAIVVGEMAFGAHKSDRPDENLLQLREFASVCEIVSCDEHSAYEYGRIKSDLRAKGRMIPENDPWIAACAIAKGLPVLSRDEHFDVIVGLERVGW